MQLAGLRSGNTFDGHRLIHLAAEHGLQVEMKERLMHAYFTENALVSDHDTLLALRRRGRPAGGRGPRGPADRALRRRGPRRRARRAVSAGISAVPCFVIDRKYGASGAQDPTVLLQFLEHGWSESHPAIQVVAEGDACGPDGC